MFKDFGSGIATDRFGILFQNRRRRFLAEEGHPNEANGGQSGPMHTIIPAMRKQAGGRVIMPFGVMGGQYPSRTRACAFTSLRTWSISALTPAGPR